MIFVTADLHLGHRNIVSYRPFMSYEAHDAFIIKNWNSTITKHDTVIVLGDVAFSSEGLEKVSRLCGRKILVLGNHDAFPPERYRKYFGRPRLFYSTGDYIMSHVPIHPESLRNKINIHGHTHFNAIDDCRYRCVCLEHTQWKPIPLEKEAKYDVARRSG